MLVDNVEVGRQATQHLLDLGHRRIAFFGDDVDEMHGFTAAIDRHRGYDLTLRAAGIEPDPALVQRTGFSMDGGEAAVHRVFGQAGRRPATCRPPCSRSVTKSRWVFSTRRGNSG